MMRRAENDPPTAHHGEWRRRWARGTGAQQGDKHASRYIADGRGLRPRHDLRGAIADFQKRDRRFGGVKDS